MCVQDSKHATPSICITNTDSVGEADTRVEFNIYSNQKIHGFFRVGDEFVQADGDKTDTFTTQNRIRSGLNYWLTQSGCDQKVTGWSGNRNRLQNE